MTFLKKQIATHKFYLFFLFFFCLWFLNGFFDIFSTAHWDVFLNHQRDSAGLVVNNLVLREFSSGPETAMLTRTPTPDSFWLKEKNYLIKKIQNKEIPVEQYTSQIGMQVYLLQPIWKLGLFLFKDATFHYWKAYLIATLFTAILTAISLSLFLTFMAVEFGIFPIFLSGLFIVFTNIWLTIFARNIYWQPWSWFLPMLWSMYILHRENGERLWLFSIGIFLSIFLKSTMGYEYLTTIGIASWIPVLYFTISRNWKWKYFLKISLTCISSFIIGIAGALIWHSYLLGGIGSILGRLYTRTINTKIVDTDTPIPFSQMFLNVLEKYIFQDIYLRTSLYVGFQWLCCIIILRSIPQFKNIVGEGILLDKSKYKALIICTIVGFFGALSHHVLFMQHSYVHVHMNYVLWFLPFWFLAVPLAFFKPVKFWK